MTRPMDPASMPLCRPIGDDFRKSGIPSDGGHGGHLAVVSTLVNPYDLRVFNTTRITAILIGLPLHCPLPCSFSSDLPCVTDGTGRRDLSVCRTAWQALSTFCWTLGVLLIQPYMS